MLSTCNAESRAGISRSGYCACRSTIRAVLTVALTTWDLLAGRVTLRTTAPLFYDEYRRNRQTGSFILVDEGTNNTVGAGIISGPAQ